MDKPTVAHTRLNLANERTLLAWIKLGCIIGGGGFLSHVLMPSQRAFHMENSILVSGAGHILGRSAAARIFRARSRATALLSTAFVAQRQVAWLVHGLILTVRGHRGVLVTLLLTLFQALVHEVQYNSPDCMRLKLPLQEAPPPYLYISFHGSPDPLGGLCSGVGAVHRFSLTGAYQGPATDQRAALVHAPRMMVMQKNSCSCWPTPARVRSCTGPRSLSSVTARAATRAPFSAGSAPPTPSPRRASSTHTDWRAERTACCASPPRMEARCSR